MGYVFFCAKCNNLEIRDDVVGQYKCDTCGEYLLSLGKTMEQWNELSNEEMSRQIKMVRQYKQTVSEPDAARAAQTSVQRRQVQPAQARQNAPAKAAEPAQRGRQAAEETKPMKKSHVPPVDDDVDDESGGSIIGIVLFIAGCVYLVLAVIGAIILAINVGIAYGVVTLFAGLVFGLILMGIGEIIRLLQEKK